MGLIDGLRRVAERLPLGEHPPGEDLRTTEEALADLAGSFDPSETITWAGWGWAARGAQPDDPLDEAALAVTDAGRVRWQVRPRDRGPDSADLSAVTQLLVDRRSQRVVLVTDEHHAEHPEVAVLFSFDTDDLILAVRAHVASP